MTEASYQPMYMSNPAYRAALPIIRPAEEEPHPPPQPSPSPSPSIPEQPVEHSHLEPYWNMTRISILLFILAGIIIIGAILFNLAFLNSIVSSIVKAVSST